MDGDARYQLVMIRIDEARRHAHEERLARLSRRTGSVTQSGSLDIFSRLRAIRTSWAR